MSYKKGAAHHMEGHHVSTQNYGRHIHVFGREKETNHSRITRKE